MKVFAVFMALAIAWFLVNVLLDRNPERNLVSRLAERIKPFAGMPTKVRYMDKDELWHAIGGLPGLWRLYWAAGAITTLANRCASIDPAASSAAKEVFFGAIELRILVLISLPETLACSIFPDFPRAIAWSMVRLYCDLICVLDATESMVS